MNSCQSSMTEALQFSHHMFAHKWWIYSPDNELGILANQVWRRHVWYERSCVLSTAFNDTCLSSSGGGSLQRITINININIKVNNTCLSSSGGASLQSIIINININVNIKVIIKDTDISSFGGGSPKIIIIINIKVNNTCLSSSGGASLQSIIININVNININVKIKINTVIIININMSIIIGRRFS